MSKLRIYSISDEYVNYLRSDQQLSGVSDPKKFKRSHTRKYLGVVIQNHNYKYYIPFSSPKKNDYISLPNGTIKIRNSILPIIRMITHDTQSGEIELKGTLKICDMIPVPDSELVPYFIEQETDMHYKDIIQKEYAFINANRSMIIKNAQQLYMQKTCRDEIFAEKAAPKYLDSTIDFLYAEQKCKEFIKMREKTQEPVMRKSVKDRLTEAQNQMQKSENHIKTRDDKLR